MAFDRRGLQGLLALAIGATLAGPAMAQQASDPIGAMLDAAPSTDEDAAEAAPATPAPSQPPQAAPPAAPTPYAPVQAPSYTYSAPYTPPRAYSRPPPATSGSPVHIEESGRTPDRPLSAYDMSYDARLRASSASAQGMLGPLDGSWTLNVPGIGDLYAFELVDRGGPLEGAWRDLRRRGSLGASGFVDDIQRFGAVLTLRFSPPQGGEPAVVNLTGQADGRWTGDLAERGERKPVVLRRN